MQRSLAMYVVVVVMVQTSDLVEWGPLSEYWAWGCDQEILVIMADVGEGEAAIELVKSKTEAK